METPFLRKLYLAPALLAVVVSVIDTRYLPVLAPVVLSAVLLCQSECLTVERRVSLLAGSLFSPWVIVTTILVSFIVRDPLFLGRSFRRSISLRYTLLFLAASGLMIYNPEVLYLPILSWSFITLFLKTDKVTSIGWLLQTLILGTYVIAVFDVTFIEKLLLVVAFLAVVPLKLVKRRTPGKQKTRS